RHSEERADKAGHASILAHDHAGGGRDRHLFSSGGTGQPPFSRGRDRHLFSAAEKRSQSLGGKKEPVPFLGAEELTGALEKSGESTLVLDGGGKELQADAGETSAGAARLVGRQSVHHPPRELERHALAQGDTHRDLRVDRR